MKSMNEQLHEFAKEGLACCMAFASEDVEQTGWLALNEVLTKANQDYDHLETAGLLMSHGGDYLLKYQLALTQLRTKYLIH